MPAASHRHLCIVVILLSLSVGCATVRGPLSREEVHAGGLDFLRIGETTRRQVILKLGEPSASFEGQSVLTWRLSAWGDENGNIQLVAPQRRSELPIADWRMSAWSLVLVFDGNGNLADHNLVAVK